ncbi:hypothetical protein [Marinomonas sp. THO17]|uniref:hypothetical protein n=1 Tax=Marinomonas sp. THO17 TaxID=3149048 RepID=UPI00336BF6A3
MRKGSAKCIVFYDWEGEYSLKDWLAIAFKFFQLLGVLPDHVLLGSQPDKTKASSIEELEKKVSIGKSLPKVVELFLTIPGFKQLAFGWSVFASINSYQTKTMMFCFDKELDGSCQDLLDEIIAKVTRTSAQVYGIVYERPFSKGPDMYAYGMSSGLGYSEEEMKEADSIGAWMNERIALNRHLKGHFRDIYSVNILSQNHVNSLIEGMTLARWIEENKVGSLKPLSDKVYCWSVPQSQIEDARTAIKENSLLIVECCR